MTEEIAMICVKAGELERAAFLFERNQKRIYNYFIAMGAGAHASADMTQNVFLKMLRYRKSYDPQFPFRPWIFTIGRNEYLAWIKRSGRENMMLEEFSEVQKKPADTSENELLKVALSRLDFDERQLIVLHLFEGMKYKDIAEVVQSTEGAVRVKACRALKRLRKIYFDVEKME